MIIIIIIITIIIIIIIIIIIGEILYPEECPQTLRGMNIFFAHFNLL